MIIIIMMIIRRFSYQIMKNQRPNYLFHYPTLKHSHKLHLLLLLPHGGDPPSPETHTTFPQRHYHILLLHDSMRSTNQLHRPLLRRLHRLLPFFLSPTITISDTISGDLPLHLPTTTTQSPPSTTLSPVENLPHLPLHHCYIHPLQILHCLVPITPQSLAGKSRNWSRNGSRNCFWSWSSYLVHKNHGSSTIGD